MQQARLISRKGKHPIKIVDLPERSPTPLAIFHNGVCYIQKGDAYCYESSPYMVTGSRLVDDNGRPVSQQEGLYNEE